MLPVEQVMSVEKAGNTASNVYVMLQYAGNQICWPEWNQK